MTDIATTASPARSVVFVDSRVQDAATLLQGLKPGAEAAVVGPTATLLAQPYARRGVTVLGGTRVRDPDTLLDLLAEGGSGLHFFGKSVDRVTLRLETAA